MKHRTANEMIDAMIEVVDKELDREEPHRNAHWVLAGLHENQLRQVKDFLRSFKQAESVDPSRAILIKSLEGLISSVNDYFNKTNPRQDEQIVRQWQRFARHAIDLDPPIRESDE